MERNWGNWEPSVSQAGADPEQVALGDSHPAVLKGPPTSGTCPHRPGPLLLLWGDTAALPHPWDTLWGLSPSPGSQQELPPPSSHCWCFPAFSHRRTSRSSV